jgi:hypothetical protein
VVILISLRDKGSFDDYMTIVVILLTLPLAYFGFHYLRSAYQEARDERLFSKKSYRNVENGVGDETDEAVRQLTES